MDIHTQVDRAHEIALKAHDGQVYGNRDYFAHHVQGVVRNTMQLYWGLKTEIKLQIFIAAALLHDAVEDSDLTLDDLAKEGFNERTIRAVGLVTKPADKSNFSLDEYLSAIREDEVARVVKTADILFNMTSCIGERNRDRYIYYSKQMSKLL